MFFPASLGCWSSNPFRYLNALICIGALACHPRARDTRDGTRVDVRSTQPSLALGSAISSRYARPSARNRITRCEGVAPNAVVSSIDDFEQPLKPDLWFVYTDGSQGQLRRDRVAENRGHVLHVKSAGFRSWGSGFGVQFGTLTAAHRACEIDASRYAGLRFRARGRGQLRLSISTTPLVAIADGGSCELAENCYDWPGTEVHLGSDWSTFEFRFCELMSVGWGQRAATVDPQHLYALHFRLAEGQEHELWLDDIAFVPHSPELDQQRCGPPCPRDAVPSNAVIEPTQLSTILASAGVTLHNFEQATKSCGSLTRRYLSYVPKRLGPDSSAPVVIALHGAGASAEAFRHYQTHGRFEALSERDGFIVVYGNAAPGAATVAVLPNSGSWYQEPSAADEVDDIAYLTAVRDDLKQRHVIDGRNEFFLVGQSNGGGMAIEAVRRNPEIYTGFAALMPYLGLKPELPAIGSSSRLSRVLFAYSEADPALPKGYSAQVSKFANTWATALGISPEVIASPARVLIPDHVNEGTGYTGSFAAALVTRNSRGVQLDLGNAARSVSVRILQFDHAGHFWPNPVQDSLNLIVEKWGLRNQDIDAADAVWEFFRD